MTRPDISKLSFVASRDGKALPLPVGNQLPRCFWNVPPQNSSWEASALGDRLALEYLAYEAAEQGGPGLLPKIVEDMPQPLTAVEISFLTVVSYAATAGRHEGERIVRYWDECRARLARKEAEKREKRRVQLAEARRTKAMKGGAK